MMGGGGVGKSAITIRFIQNHFVLEYDPTIEDSYRKQVRIDEETAVLEVLDTAGQEEYSAMREQWIRYGEGFFIVYSLESRGSFEKELSPLLQQLERVRDVEEVNEIPIILFANKLDLANHRQVSTDEGRELAKKWGSGFFEGSAKSFINIEESFFDLVRSIRRKRLVGVPEPNPISHSTKKKQSSQSHSRGCSLF